MMTGKIGKILIILITLSLAKSAFAQGSAGNSAIYESRFAVDMPTAGVIPKSNYAVAMQFFTGDGLAIDVDFGLLRNLNVGLSLSGSNIIGSGDIKMQTIPGLNAKYRFFDETLSIPAFVIGFNTQGNGYYNDNSNRFEFFSPGIFLAASKNFSWDLGDLAIHGGINYSFENPSKNFLLNYYFGLEQSLLSRWSLNLEYNSSVFEREVKRFEAPGLLNSAIRYSIGEGFTAELQLRDLLETVKHYNSIVRYVKIEYINRF